jgi:hypothetical protein
VRETSLKTGVAAAIIAVAAVMAFPAHGQSETFWHDEITKEEWQVIKEREGWIKQQAASCVRERLRLSDAHGQATAYLDQRDRTLSGGYVGSGIILREERRIQRIVYKAFDAIQAISYSLGERSDPAAECRDVANEAISGIKVIVERYP